MKKKHTRDRCTRENPFFKFPLGSFLVQQVISMSVFSLLCLLLLCYQLVHAHSEEVKHGCKETFTCGKLGNLGYPFTSQACPRPDSLTVSNCDGNDHPRIQLQAGGRELGVESISQSDTISINDESLRQSMGSRSCKYFQDLDLPKTQFLSFRVMGPSLTILKCNQTSTVPFHPSLPRVDCSEASGYEYYSYHHSEIKIVPSPHCSIIDLPISQSPPEANTSDLFSLVSYKFKLRVEIHAECVLCHHLGGQCERDSKGRFHCAKGGNDKLGLKLGLALGLGIGWALLIVAICILLYIRRRRNIHESAASEHTRNCSSHHSSVADPEEGSICNGVYIFCYSELEEATNHFKESNEIGDGRFGSSYYGKLQNGREIAVKRLCGYNNRRLERFRNEVETLTRLRHRNLVSLYGCTSGYCREFLLVYEYISNGTLAHHLRSGFGSSIPWHVRMSIAVQTARALAYLHESNTIHRDLKTENILLDNDFTVKISGFEISRLFPVNFTHASTTPLGTPGYVDPEYLQCFQLTEKSDVYSFGVVLIELITSMPAFDTSKRRDELSLANLAMNRIRDGTFGEIVDPCLGFDKNEGTRNMIMSVARLASQCLKQDKEMRPNMAEVKESLKMIQRSK